MVIYVFYVHFRTHISEIWVWLSGYLRYLRPFSHTYIRKLSLVKWLSTLSTSIFGHMYSKLSSVAWFTLDILVKPINLHYLRCFPKVNQFEKWLNGYLRYLRPFSHTHIRNLSLVIWLIYVYYVHFRTHKSEIWVWWSC